MRIYPSECKSIQPTLLNEDEGNDFYFLDLTKSFKRSAEMTSYQGAGTPKYGSHITLMALEPIQVKP